MNTLNEKKSTDREYMMLGIQIIGDFGASIAVPVVGLVLLGQWLEGKYGYAPWFTVTAFILAAFISGKMIYKKAKEYSAKYQAIDNQSRKS